MFDLSGYDNEITIDIVSNGGGNYDDLFELDSEEYNYFYGYLNTENAKKISDLLNIFGINLTDLSESVVYDTINNISDKLGDLVSNFMENCCEAANEVAENEVKTAHTKILFHFEKIINPYIKLNFDILSNYCSENNINSIQELIDSQPNKIDDYITGENFTFSDYTDVADYTEANRLFETDLDELIDEFETETPEVYREYSIYKNVIDGLGFVDNVYENDRFLYKIIRFITDTQKIELYIKDKKKDKSKTVQIPPSQISNYVNTEKMDFFFEGFKWKYSDFMK
jgi:hypothetical protein